MAEKRREILADPVRAEAYRAADRESHRKTWAENPDYRDRKKAYDQREDRLKKMRDINREAYRADPRKFCDRVNARYASDPNVRRLAKNTKLKPLGFTIELFENLLKAQGNACAVCGSSFEGVPSKRIHADHCHDTQTPRGILCHHCNTIEGLLLKTGLSPQEFGRLLGSYLEDTPFSKLSSGEPDKGVKL
jgi:hypothetical protein